MSHFDLKKKTIKESKGTNYSKMKKKANIIFYHAIIGEKICKIFPFFRRKISTDGNLDNWVFKFFKKWRAKTLM